MTRLAITNALGHVVTFVRADVPPGWQPPAGCKAVPEAALPVGYKMAAALPQPVPESVTAYQARAWLIESGIGQDAIAEAIARIEDPKDREKVRAWWEYEPVLFRSAPQIARWGDACGFTSQQIDDAFRAAAMVRQ